MDNEERVISEIIKATEEHKKQKALKKTKMAAWLAAAAIGLTGYSMSGGVDSNLENTQTVEQSVENETGIVDVRVPISALSNQTASVEQQQEKVDTQLPSTDNGVTTQVETESQLVADTGITDVRVPITQLKDEDLPEYNGVYFTGTNIPIKPEHPYIVEKKEFNTSSLEAAYASIDDPKEELVGRSK